MARHTGGTAGDKADDPLARQWYEHARHAALRADVQAALGEPGPVRAILQRCAEALVAHLDAAFARIWLLDAAGPVLVLQASAGCYTHLDGGHSRIPVGQLKIGLIAEERRPYLTNAVASDPRIEDQGWARREGMVAFAGYPLVVEARLVGVVALFARAPLGAGTLDAIASVATALAQGVERKRAEERLRAREAEYRGIFEATSDGLLITDAAGQTVAANPAAGLLFGYPADALAGMPLAALLPDDQHERLRDYLAAAWRAGRGRAQLTGRHRDGRTFPLDIRGTTLDYQGRPHLLSAARDIAERVEERQRLARELHDSVAQALYGVTLSATAAARLLAAGDTARAATYLGEIRETSEEALREMRLLIFELRPPILEREGLVAALQARLDAVEGRAGGLEATLEARDAPALPPALEEAIYRIAQEALNNVLKHARARRVTVTLEQDGPLARLLVADDGAGFDPSATRRGLGLRGMAERAAQIGGTLRVTSAPGRGTLVRLEVPR